MKNLNMYGKILLNLLILISIVCFCIFFIPPLLKFFLPFVIGWIIAMIANPLVRFMEKKIKIVRKHGSAIIIIAVLAAVIGIIYLTCLFLKNEIVSLMKYLQDQNNYSVIESQLEVAATKIEGLFKGLPFGIQDKVVDFVSNLDEYIKELITDIKIPAISMAGNVAKNVVEVLFTSIIAILSSYFFIAERDYIIEKIHKIIPQSVQKQIDIIGESFKTAVGGYFKAQFKIMIVITLILFISFLFLKVPYSFLLALGIAFLDFLPIFGTGAILWPWAFIDLFSGKYVEVVCLMIIYAVCQVVKQILQPKMVGDSIGMSPLMTLVFMYIGYKIAGIIGIIIGIPIGMVLINLYHTGIFNHNIQGIKIIINDINEYRKF